MSLHVFVVVTVPPCTQVRMDLRPPQIKRQHFSHCEQTHVHYFKAALGIKLSSIYYLPLYH